MAVTVLKQVQFSVGPMRFEVSQVDLGNATFGAIQTRITSPVFCFVQPLSGGSAASPATTVASFHAAVYGRQTIDIALPYKNGSHGYCTVLVGGF